MDLKRLKDKAQGLLRDNSDKIERGLGKAQQVAGDKAPKYRDKIDQAAGKVRDAVEKGRGDGPDQAAGGPAAAGGTAAADDVAQAANPDEAGEQTPPAPAS